MAEAEYINVDMLISHIAWLIQHEDYRIHCDTARRIMEDIEQLRCVCNPPMVINVKGDSNEILG